MIEKLKKNWLWGVVLTALFTGSFFIEETTPSSNHITPERAKHILYGDHTGGGHKYGVGKPCKSEFPKDWSDKKILNTVNQIVAEGKHHWRLGDNGYAFTNAQAEDLTLRVVINNYHERNVITAYPLNRPRNPCPANDN